MRDKLDILAKSLRHPLRILVVLLAVTSVVAPLSNPAGVVIALLAALVGIGSGELLGRVKRLRPWGAVILLIGVTVGGIAIGRLIVGLPLVASVIGPAWALQLRAAVVVATLALSATTGLRLLAVRMESWRFVELGATALAFVASFAAHRGGSIARPLWLSDWAWQNGYDPGNVLMTLAAVFAVAAAALLLMESKHRLSGLTVLALPILALLVLSALEPSDLTAEDPADALEAIQNALPEGRTQDLDTVIPVTIGKGDDPLTSGGGNLDGPDGPVVRDGGAAGGEGGEAEAGEGESGGEGGAGQDAEQGEEGAGGGEDGEQGAGGEGEGQQGGADGESEGEQGEGEGGQGEQGEGGSDPGEGEQGGGEEGAEQGGGEGEGEEQGAGGDAQGDAVADASEDGQSGGQGSSQGSSDGDPEEGDPSDGQQDGEEEGPPPEGLSEADQALMEFDGGQQQGGGASVSAVVVFQDDYRTPSGYYYFRQDVHSKYVGSRMDVADREDADLDVLPDFPERLIRVDEPPPFGARERVRAKVALLGNHDLPFALESPALYSPASNPNPDRFSVVYAFESYAQEIPYDQLVGRAAGNPSWSDDLRDYYLTAPADPRYQALVDSILAPLPDHARSDPFTRALAIKVWLDENSKYSVTRRYPDADDPTADFLFGDLVGYCVHTAHAAAYLWRLAGVPARVGTGYLVDESGRQGSSLLVMGGDAHAWPELYLDGVGWIPLDVSPSENLDPAGQPVDQDLTQALGEMVRQAEQTPEVVEPPFPFGMWLRRGFLVFAGSLLLFGLLGHYTVKGWRRARPYAAFPAAVPRVGYRAILDRLVDAGFAREEGETREAFARRLAAAIPSLGVLTDLHVAAAYADPSRPRDPELSTWRAALDRFDDELADASPWWRRALGALDPSSFYRAR